MFHVWRKRSKEKCASLSFEQTWGSNTRLQGSLPEARPPRRSFLIAYTGDTLKVHIQNLVIPADDRCFRNLDTKHAHCLKQFYENQQMCHTILIGNIVSDVTTDKGNLSKFLQEPGKVAVETLGGNHTRHALQCLFASQTKPISMVTCRLYNKLPDELALQLGYEHNASYTLGKPTSLVDLVNVFRKEEQQK
ncbi:unnamed protein product [Mytilus edulis]|uniref:Uncharacterized protein n=1 Tax=Mytilus edulis TaxID=6550 RepID=A0A8S3T7X2_MYTED|nr:unnamed protein product [Mytilus edulis]